MINIRRQARLAALMCAVAATGACDQLLEVDLPSAITSDALDDPGTAALQVNSVIGAVECAYSALTVHASGLEDNFQRVAGSGPAFSQYIDTPSGGDCDTGNWDDSFVENLLVARFEGYRAYNLILNTTATVANKERLLSQLAMYNAVTLGVFGEYFCEFAISSRDAVTGAVTFGTLMTPSQTLDVAEGWADSVFLHLAAADTVLSTTAGVISTNIGKTTYGLRARIRYANGDLAGAAADAVQVNDGHMSWVLREDPEDRRNAMALVQGNANSVQAQGFLQGAVTVGANPGISELGAHPVAGTPYAGGWPNPVPFTGYLNLAIETATGRAVSDTGYPLTTGTGMTADTRVPHANGNTAGGTRPVQRKYTTLATDIPLLNWREMRLIRAEEAYATSPTTAVDHVNAIRTAAGLPLVQGTYRTLVESDADRFDDLIIEERRRALWLEARFWSTKIQKNEKLWFPRRLGEWVNVSSYELFGGVRMLMPNSEYEINPNFGRAARGTGCAPGERPVFN